MDSDQTIMPPGKQGNTLLPVFLKLERLRLLIVGGGPVGLEKLQAVLQNAPSTAIRLVAIHICEEIRQLAADHPNVTLLERAFDGSDLEEADLVISAVRDDPTSERICAEARQRGKLINVADQPQRCDFYLSSVVKKGNLKIAISTNGQSPTIAKRLKEAFNELLPDELDQVLDHMHIIRSQLNGSFAEKVQRLNEITKVLSAKQAKLDEINSPGRKKWQRIVQWCLFAFFFMLLGHGLLSLVPFSRMPNGIQDMFRHIDLKVFLMMLSTGFIAQMVDGSLGMGYGTISTTFLLAIGVSPAIVSSRVHSARTFSSGVSGFSHHRFGNINKKLFRTLAWPGIIGAVLGATLAFFGQRYANWVRIPLSGYTLYLGYFIIRKGIVRIRDGGKVKRAGWLASVGGFLDAFAGGGWGTLVTSTLIAKRRNPRYVVGSVCLAEFFVVLASSITFFIFLKSIPLADVAGLIAGGLLAAPIAARLVGRLPMKAMFIAIGSLVILTSLTTGWRALSHLIH
jgi:siroheme synthase-like protein